jgi:predicted nucleic acid-binding protein
MAESLQELIWNQGQGKPGSNQVAKAEWLSIMNLEEMVSFPPALLGLNQGEADVILLARKLNAYWVLMDEKLGRKIAQTMGLRVKGALGVLLAACKAGIISAGQVEEAPFNLEQSSVRVAPRWREWLRKETAKV